MSGTIRTFDAGVREELHAALRATATAIAEASGASVNIVIGPSVPVTGNDPQLLQQMLPTLRWAAGKDKVFEGNLITGAEDFSFFQQHVPGLFLMLGVNEPGVSAGDAAANHSPLFNASEAALMSGVRALVGFAMDYAEVTSD